jgi:hypothetical protein
MTAPVIANPTVAIGIVLIDPTTGLPYVASGSGGGATLGSSLTFATATGTTNDVNPGGAWPTGIGRVDVTLAAGVATWTGLVAGADGQMVEIFNADAANTLTLNANPAGSVAGSAAANRFQWVGNMALAPGATAILVYSAGTVNRWRLN